MDITIVQALKMISDWCGQQIQRNIEAEVVKKERDDLLAKLQRVHSTPEHKAMREAQLARDEERARKTLAAVAEERSKFATRE